VPRYMLDTNICIYIRQKKPQAVLRRFEKLAAGDAGVSVVSYGELLYGVQKSADSKAGLRQLAELTSVLPVLPLPVGSGETCGAIRALLERRGESIGNTDLWIAAHAKTASLTLVTNSESEFKRVPGLRVENWAA